MHIKKGQQLGIRFDLADNGKPMKIAAFGCVLQPKSGGPAQPLMMPVIHQTLKGPIADIITGWAMHEMHLDEFTQICLSHQQQSVIRWRDQPFSARLRLQISLFKELFSEKSGLFRYYQENVVAPTWDAKKIRDLLGHSIMWGFNEGGQAKIEFITKKLGKKTKKSFSSSQLQDIANKIFSAAGHFSEIATASSSLPLASHEIQVLQLVLGKDRWNVAINRALGLQP